MKGIQHRLFLCYFIRYLVIVLFDPLARCEKGQKTVVFTAPKSIIDPLVSLVFVRPKRVLWEQPDIVYIYQTKSVVIQVYRISGQSGRIHHFCATGTKKACQERTFPDRLWSRWQDLNLRPFGPEIRTNVRFYHLQTGKGRLSPRFFVADGQGVTESVAG